MQITPPPMQATPAYSGRGPVPPLRAVRGLSIVELLVSITIGLLVVGAVLYVYLGSRGSYRTNKSTSRIQESGRFGLDAILHDVREVGYIGCGSRESVSTGAPIPINSIATQPLNALNPALPFATPNDAVRGYTAGSTTFPWTQPTGAVVQYRVGDVLVLRVATANPAVLVKDPDPTVPAITVANNCAGSTTGAYVMVSSCSMATLLRVTNAPPNSCNANGSAVSGGVQFVYGASMNSTTALAPGGAPVYSAASIPSAQPFDEFTYFVGQLPGRPWPALYRYSATAMSQTSTNPVLPEEISDHIENMCVLYGIGANTSSNASADVVYEAADTVYANTAWADVVGVRISLLVAADELGGVDPGQKIAFCGNTITETDGRLRQVFTGTAALRDRLQ